VAARLSTVIALSLVVGHHVRRAAKKKEGNDIDSYKMYKKNSI